MRARVRLYKGQILELYRSTNDKAFMVAHVPIIRFVSQESLAAHEVRSRASDRTYRHVLLLMEIEFLVFSHGWPWDTFVWLVSLGECLICTNL